MPLALKYQDQTTLAEERLRDAIANTPLYNNGMKHPKLPDENRFMRWILTFNGPASRLMEIRDAIESRWSELARYIIIALENNGTGGLHMHAFMSLHHRMSPSKMIAAWPFLSGVNFTCCGSQQTDMIINYVKKQGDWEEWGNRPHIRAAQTQPQEKPKRMSRPEKITSMVRRLSTGELTRAEAMLEDTNLWMEKGEEMLRMANLLRAERDRKNFVTPPLRPWQQEVEELIINQNDREILFVVDTMGNRGKTWFCQYMRQKYGALILHDSESRAASYLWQMEKMVLFDIPRSAVPSYATMENMKNGFIISEKYKVQTKVQQGMKVAVFMNQTPASGYLSMDRVRIYDLDRQGEVKFITQKQKTLHETLPRPPNAPKKDHNPVRHHPYKRQESNESTSTTASVRRALESGCTIAYEQEQPLQGIDTNTERDKNAAKYMLDQIAAKTGAQGLENAQWLLLEYLKRCYDSGQVIELNLHADEEESDDDMTQRADTVYNKVTGKVSLHVTPEKSFQVLKPRDTIPNKDIKNLSTEDSDMDGDDDCIILEAEEKELLKESPKNNPEDQTYPKPTDMMRNKFEEQMYIDGQPGLTQQLIDAAEDAEVEWPEDSQDPWQE